MPPTKKRFSKNKPSVSLSPPQPVQNRPSAILSPPAYPQPIPNKPSASLRPPAATTPPTQTELDGMHQANLVEQAYSDLKKKNIDGLLNTSATQRAQSDVQKNDLDAYHLANLAEQAKWAEQKKAEEVQSRVDAVSSQARHPWEPKGAKSPIVKTKEQSIEDMDREIDAMALKTAGKSAVPKQPAPTVLQPRVAAGQEPSNPATDATRQKRNPDYADEYKKRYAAALAGSVPSARGLR